MKVVFFVVVVALATVECKRKVFDVAVDTSKARMTSHLKGSGLTQKFCTTKDKECDGQDISKAKFASTPRQCTINCAVHMDCLSAFLDENKMCHLRSNRCSLPELIDGLDGSTDFYRLKEGETCPANRPEFVAQNIYSGKFCMAWGKACKSEGHDLYRKPLIIYSYMKCLQKCLAISSCGGVDFNNNLCIPKDYQCPDSDLEDETGTYNFIRLAKGVDDCEPNRSPPPDKEPKVVQSGRYVVKLTTSCTLDSGLTAKEVLFLHIAGDTKNCGTQRTGGVPRCNTTSLVFNCPEVPVPKHAQLVVRNNDRMIIKELLIETGGKQYAGYCNEDNKEGGCGINAFTDRRFALIPPVKKYRYEVKLTLSCHKDAGVAADTLHFLYIYGGAKTCKRKLTEGKAIERCETTTLHYDCAVPVVDKIKIYGESTDWIVISKIEITVDGNNHTLTCGTANTYKGCMLGLVRRLPRQKTWPLAQ